MGRLVIVYLLLLRYFPLTSSQLTPKMNSADKVDLLSEQTIKTLSETLKTESVKNKTDKRNVIVYLLLLRYFPLTSSQLSLSQFCL
jgi:hypothetical protein